MNELKRPSAKRLLAWLLAIVLCVGAIPADAVFAEPEAASGTQAQSEDAQSEDGVQPQEAGLEDAGGESAQAEDGQTEYQVTFLFCVANDFYSCGEENGQTVRTVQENGTITGIQEEYVNENRKIVGWKDSETGESVDIKQSVTRNMTLLPILDKYQLAFNSMDFNYYQTFYVDPGQTFTEVPELPVEEHYTFEYWYGGSGMTGQEEFSFETTEINQDYYFEAKVSRDFTYRATLFLADDFEESEAGGIIEYADETAMLDKPVYENDNRKVIGWKEMGQEEEFDFSEPLTHDVQLYPIYDKYMLLFDGETAYADAGKTLTDVPKGEDWDHRTFKGWECWDPESGDVKLFDFSTEPITQDLYFYAVYERDYAYMVNFAWDSDFDDVFDFETRYLKEGEKPKKPPVLDNGTRKITGWTTVRGSRTEYDFMQEVTEDLYLYPIYDKCKLVFGEGTDDDTTIYVTAGQRLTNVPQESREHYSFGGWKYFGWDEETETYVRMEYDFTQPITQDYYFDAIWNRNFAYQVNFNYASDFWDYFEENGIDAKEEVYLREGETLSEPPKYDNGTRKITGWTETEGSNQPYDFTAELTDDLDLYPIMNKCRLRFGKKNILYVDYGSVVNTEDLPVSTKEHYIFRGWGLTSKKLFDFTQPIYKDYTFKAVWKKDFDYTVTYNFGSDFYDYVEENQIEDTVYIKSGENDTITSPLKCSNGKREIIGWKEWGSDQPFDFGAVIDRDVDLYPIYDKCMVTFYDYENIYEWRQDVYVTPGQTVTPPAAVKDTYYTFKGWKYWDLDDNFVTFDFKTPVTEDISLEADWEPNFYSIDFYNNLEEDNVPYWHGEFRVIKGRTAAGFRQQVGDPVVKGHYFAGWYYDEECTQPFNENTVLTKSIGLYAKWGTNSDGSSVTPGNGNEKKVTSVTLSAASLTIPKGKSQVLTVTTAPLKNAAITWSSSDNSVATVNGGTVTAKKAGEATITATAAGGVKASCKVTVAEVKLNASSAELKTKQSSTALKIESKYPKNDTVVSWKSSNPKVVKVDKKGKITADKKTGTATITVTMKSGATATCKVTVKKKAVKTKKLTMNVKKLTMKKGKSVSLSVTRDPITATEKIKWSSSNKKVATVTSNGKVKAKKKGKATITAKSSNGKKATCKITVK